MPNHITNKIYGPSVVLSALVNADGEIDFRCIIPVPEDYEEGHCTHGHGYGSLLRGEPDQNQNCCTSTRN